MIIRMDNDFFEMDPSQEQDVVELARKSKQLYLIRPLNLSKRNEMLAEKYATPVVKADGTRLEPVQDTVIEVLKR